MAYAALCRIVQAATGIGSIAVFAADGGGFVLRHATEAYLALGAGAAEPSGALDLAPEGLPPPPSAGLGTAGSGTGSPEPNSPDPMHPGPVRPDSLRPDPMRPDPKRYDPMRPHPIRLDPARLGIEAALALVLPFGRAAPGAPPGLLVIASRRPRRVGPRLAEALRDAAEVAGRLLPAPAATASPAPAATAPPVPAALPAAAASPAPGRRSRPAAPAALSRTALHQLIASLLRARERREPLAFLIVDVDRFRAVNEALGTEAGDGALAAIGARLTARVEEPDRLIRLEGDRFLVVTSPARREVTELARALLDAVAEPVDLPGRRLALRASAGVVLAGRAETSPVRLLMQADTALRRAKAAGGNRIEIHEPGFHAALLESSRLELDLRHALEAREFSLVFQPYVALATGALAGVEALLRWTHPKRGEIAPATFIPLAEATGQILPIGNWALHAACAAAAGWPGDFALAVNISPLQFHAPGFVEQVDAVLAATGFPAGRLELEITETVLMRDNPETTAQLRALIARGIRIALDDFGTGYSALAYLSRLPHHRIKLDKSFVQDLGRPSTAGLIRAIIALARAGGIMTTAEGVERPEQLQAVRALGFTHAQGFATGLPIEDPGALRQGASAG